MLVQWLALLPQARPPDCLCEFPLGALISSHSPHLSGLMF